eukprot:2029578-Amphidinium_carterae.2
MPVWMSQKSFMSSHPRSPTAIHKIRQEESMDSRTHQRCGRSIKVLIQITALDKLQWMAAVRPDIQYAVKELNRKLSAPIAKDESAAKHLIRYLKDTHNLVFRCKIVRVERTCSIGLTTPRTAYCSTLGSTS